MSKGVVHEFLTSNDWEFRLGRTILQGVLAVVVANLDLLLGFCALEPSMRAFFVALIMAALSPVMAELGAACADGENDG